MNIRGGTINVVEVRLGHGFLERNVSSRCVNSSILITDRSDWSSASSSSFLFNYSELVSIEKSSLFSFSS